MPVKTDLSVSIFVMLHKYQFRINKANRMTIKLITTQYVTSTVIEHQIFVHAMFYFNLRVFNAETML